MVKFNPDGSVERLKVCLVAKGYTQMYGIDFDETFFPVAKISYVCVLISLAAKISIGPCYDWMSKIPFYMGTCMRKFIWSNHFGLLRRGTIRVVSGSSKKIYMVSSNH
jgi:hypothetical protein